MGEYPRRATDQLLSRAKNLHIYLIIPASNIHWEERGTISRKLEQNWEEGLDGTPYPKFLCGSVWILTYLKILNCRGCSQKTAEQLLQNDSQTKPKKIARGTGFALFPRRKKKMKTTQWRARNIRQIGKFDEWGLGTFGFSAWCSSSGVCSFSY